MVAIVTGSGLGLFNSSLSVLGEQGRVGDASLGQGNESFYVNAATGNLSVRQRDEFIASQGLDTSLVRTYNSQGLLNDDNGDNWRFNVPELRWNDTFTSIKRVDGDGTVSAFSGPFANWTSTDGGGAHQSLIAGGGFLVWADDDRGIKEFYDANTLQLIRREDRNGNTTNFTFTGGLITEINDQSAGQSLLINYDPLVSGRVLSLTTQTLNSNNVATQINRVSYGYDTAGRLSTLSVDLTPENSTDNKFYITTYTYFDGLGNNTLIDSISQSDNTTVSFTYELVEAEYRVKTITDGLGKVSTLDYSVAEQTTVTDALGLITTYQYSTQNGSRLTGIISANLLDGSNVSRQFEYDAQDNVTAVIDGNGNRIEYNYDNNGNRILERDAQGNTLTRVYSNDNLLLSETGYQIADPDGAGPQNPSGAQTTYYAYNSNGNLRFIISPQGRVSEYQYNAVGQRETELSYLQSTYDTSTLTNTSLLSEAQLQSWVGSLTDLSQAQRLDTVYDFRGNVETVSTYATVLADGTGDPATISTTRYIYDQNGLLLQRIDPRGEATPADNTDYLTSYTYDGLGRLTSTVDAQGISTLYSYNIAGQIKTSYDNGYASANIYDVNGRLNFQLNTGKNGRYISYRDNVYDSAGRLRMVTDENGNISHTLYDNANRPVMTVDSEGTLRETGYDNAGNVIFNATYGKAVSALSLNLLINDVDMQNLALSTLRDEASTAQDRISWYVYDNSNRLVYTLQRDAGNLTTSSYAVSQNSYDGLGRLTNEIRYNTLLGDSKLRVVPDTKNGLSTAPSIADVQAANLIINNFQDRQIRYFYNNDNQRIATLDAEGYLVEFTYDAAGQLKDTLGYATQITDFALQSTGDLAALKAQIGVFGANANDQRSANFYNARGQLIGQLDSDGYLNEYQYDGAGNRNDSVRYGDLAASYTGSESLAQLRPATYLTVNQRTVQQYNALNQRVQSIQFYNTSTGLGVTTAYEYDSVGQLVKTTRGINTGDVRINEVQYDVQGRVVRTLDGNGSAALAALPNGGTQGEQDAIWIQYAQVYAYDKNGNRTRSTDANGNSTYYYYDKEDRLRYQVNAEGEVIETRYNANGEAVANVQYATAISTVNLNIVTIATLKSRVNDIADSIKDRVTQQYYNLRGAISGIINAENQSVTLGYNSFGEQSSSTRLLSGFWQRNQQSYDRRGLQTVDVKSLYYTTDKQTRITQYDAFGRVAQQTDANSNVTTYNYGQQVASGLNQGRAVTTIYAAGNLGNRQITYDAFNRVLSQIDGNGQETRFRYFESSVSQVQWIYSPNGDTDIVVSNYDDENTSQVRWGGNFPSRQTQYDKNGNATKRIDENGNELNYVYDNADRLIESTDKNGIKTVYAYDRANRIISQIVDPSVVDEQTPANNYTGLNLQTQFVYDDTGNPIQTIDPNGVITQTEYNRKGEVSAVVVDLGGLNLRTEYTRNEEGSLLVVIEGAGTSDARVTQYKYDSLGRRTQTIVDPFNATGNPEGLSLLTSYYYDDENNLIAQTQGDGTLDASTTRYVYDVGNRETYRINGEGEVTKNDVDNAGRIIRTTRYSDRIDVSQLAALNTAVTEADIIALLGDTRSTIDDQVQRFGYDEVGQLILSVDGEGSVTGRVYDNGGNVIRVNRYATPLSDVQLSTIDSNATDSVLMRDQINAIINRQIDLENDQITRTVYDQAGRALYQIDANGFITENRYDSAGNVIQRIAYANAYTGVYVDDNGTMQNNIRNPLNHSLNLSEDQVTRFAYDAAGRQTFSVDALGYVSEFKYDANGQQIESIRYANAITTQTDIVNGVSSFVYYQVLTSTQSEINTAITAQLDPVNDQRSKTVYDAAGQIRYNVDSLGYVTSSQYDALGNLTRSLRYNDPIQVSGSSGYFSISNPSITDTLNALSTRAVQNTAQDQISEYIYDNANRVITEISALNSADQYSENYDYDARGNVVRRQDGNGNYEYFAYDKANRVTRSIDPEGYVVDTNYNAFGLVDNTVTYMTKVSLPVTPDLRFAESSANPAANNDAETGDRITRFTYNKNGLLETQTDANLTVTRYQYDAFNNTTDIIQAEGLAEQRINRQVFDLRNQLISQTFAFGEAEASTTQFKYDAYGNQISILDPRGVETLTTDSVWAIAERERILGVANTTSNTLTIVAQLTLEYAYTTQQTFDALNRKASATDALGGVTATAYDSFGNIVKATDPNGNTQYFYYDVNSQLVLKIDAEGYASQTTYDASGNVTKIKKYTNKIVGSYDENSVIQIVNNIINPPATYLLSDAVNDQVTLSTYDVNNNLIALTDAEGNTESWTYDAAGNIKSYTNKNGYALVTLNTEYYASKRDSLGFSRDIVLAERDAILALYTATFDYDTKNNLTYERINYIKNNATQDQVNIVNASRYDALGNVIKVVEAEGLVESRTVNYTYDLLGRLTETELVGVELFNPSKPDVRTTFLVSTFSQIEYDAIGNVLSETDANGNKTQYFYNDLNQRVATLDAEGFYSTASYDAAGNAINKTTYNDRVNSWSNYQATAYDPASYVAPNVPLDASYLEVNYVYDSNNREIISTTPEVQSYSVERGFYNESIRNTKQYDASGNLIKATDGNGNPIYYFYDKNNNKIAEVKSPDALSDNIIVYWVYDENNRVVREYKDTGGMEWQVKNQQNVIIDETTNMQQVIANFEVSTSYGPNTGRATTYQYDGLGRIVETTLNQGGRDVDSITGDFINYSTESTARNTYDANGNLIENTSANQLSTLFDYDQLNRLVETTGSEFVDQNNTNVRLKTSYELDALGRVEQQTQFGLTEADNRVKLYRYRVDGKVVSETTLIGNENYSVTGNIQIVYGYDAVGNLKSKAEDRSNSLTPIGTNTSNFKNKIFSLYNYDKLNREVSRTDAVGDKFGTIYNGSGNIKETTVNGQLEYFYEYDAVGNVFKSNEQDGTTRMYFYDSNGNNTIEFQGLNSDLRNTELSSILALDQNEMKITRRSYDALNQITNEYQPTIKPIPPASLSISGIYDVSFYNEWGYYSDDTLSYSYLKSFYFDIPTIEGFEDATFVVEMNYGGDFFVTKEVPAGRVTYDELSIIRQIDWTLISPDAPGGGLVQMPEVTIRAKFSNNKQVFVGSYFLDENDFSWISANNSQTSYQVLDVRRLHFNNQPNNATQLTFNYAEYYLTVNNEYQFLDWSDFENNYYNLNPNASNDEIYQAYIVTKFDSDGNYIGEYDGQDTASLLDSNSDKGSYFIYNYGGYDTTRSQFPAENYIFAYDVYDSDGLILNRGQADLLFKDTTINNFQTDLTHFRDGGDVLSHITSYEVSNLVGDILNSAINPLNLDASNAQKRFEYDNFGNVIKYTDGEGVATNYGYNKRDQLTYDQRAVIANRYYDASGREVAQRDQKGQYASKTAYNGNNIDKVFYADGGRTEYEYDVFGDKRLERKLIDNTNGETFRTTRYEYDNKSQLTRIISPNSFSEYFVYDEAGQQIRYRNALNNVLSTRYDAAGRVTFTRTNEGILKRYTYTYDASIGARSDGSSIGGYRVTTYENGDGDVRNSYTETDLYGKRFEYKDQGNRVYNYQYNAAGLLSTETNSLGLLKTYSYYRSGDLKTVDFEGQTYEFQYDNVGRRIREIDAEGVTLITYDDFGREDRVQKFADLDSSYGDNTSYLYYVDTEYDPNGNVLSVSSYANYAGARDIEKTLTYSYDAMNRVTKWDEADSALSGSYGDYGKFITYNLVGDRTSSKFINSGSANTSIAETETYFYTLAGYLEDVYLNGELLAKHSYDMNGNRLYKIAYTAWVDKDFSADESTMDVYLSEAVDVDGNLLITRSRVQWIFNLGWTESSNQSVSAFLQSLDFQRNSFIDQTGNRQDPASQNKAYRINQSNQYFYDKDNRKTYDSEIYKLEDLSAVSSAALFYKDEVGKKNNITYVYNSDGTLGREVVYDLVSGSINASKTYNFTYWDSPKITGATLYSVEPPPADPAIAQNYFGLTEEASRSYNSVSGYADNNGRYKTDYNGRVTSDSEFEHRWFYANDRLTMNFGDRTIEREGFSYAENLNGAADNVRLATANQYRNSTSPYIAISPSYPGTSANSFTAQQGDTLSSIAGQLWGDESLWYLLADRNGLSGDVQLKQGELIRIPNVVANTRYTSETFKVYSEESILGYKHSGRLEPEYTFEIQEVRPKDRCGGFLKVIVIIVAVVVTYITAGAAAAPVAAAVGTVLGASATLIVSGAIVGAVAAVAGSVASQLVGIGLRVQDKFSWDAVATAAIGGAVSGGLGEYLSGAGSTGAYANTPYQAPVWEPFTNGLLQNAASQGVEIIRGNQKGLNARDLFAAGIASTAISELSRGGANNRSVQIGPANSAPTINNGGNPFVNNLITQGSRILTGAQSSFDYVNLAGNVLGNALGNEIKGWGNSIEAIEVDNDEFEGFSPESVGEDFAQTVGLRPEDGRDRSRVLFPDNSLGSEGFSYVEAELSAELDARRARSPFEALADGLREERIDENSVLGELSALTVGATTQLASDLVDVAEYVYNNPGEAIVSLARSANSLIQDVGGVLTLKPDAADAVNRRIDNASIAFDEKLISLEQAAQQGPFEFGAEAAGILTLGGIVKKGIVPNKNLPRSTGAENVVQFEKLKADLARQELLDAIPTGSALKGSGSFSPRTFGSNNDISHSSPTFARDLVNEGRHFTIKGGDGVNRNFTQVPGEIDGQKGVFEFIVDPDPAKGLTHQRFIKGGAITGSPNQVVR